VDLLASEGMPAPDLAQRILEVSRAMTPSRNRTPSDYRSIAELKQGILDGKVLAGSTIEVAVFGHPELASETAVQALLAFLRLHSLRLDRSTEVRAGPIWIHPPENRTA